MEERWKKIEGFEDRYQISTSGRVRSKNGVLKAILDAHGYGVVSFRILGTGKPYKKVQIKIHRAVWKNFKGEIPSGLVLDHINKNRADNRVENLRLATYSENMLHSAKPNKGTHSTFKGIRLRADRTNKPWEVSIQIEGKRYWLGLFATEIEAATAYDFAAIKHAGKFAETNLIKTADSLEIYDSI